MNIQSTKIYVGRDVSIASAVGNVRKGDLARERLRRGSREKPRHLRCGGGRSLLIAKMDQSLQQILQSHKEILQWHPEASRVD